MLEAPYPTLEISVVQCWKPVVRCWTLLETNVANVFSNIGNFKGPMLESCCPILAMHQSNVGHYLTIVGK